MLSKIVPCLRKGVSVCAQGDGSKITCGEKYSVVNRAGSEIVFLIDGVRSVSGIVEAILENHKLAVREDVEEKVLAFLRDLWMQGLYLDSSVDAPFVLFFCSKEGYAVLPSHCEVTDLPCVYASPCYKLEALQSMRLVHARLLDSALRVVRFDPSGKIDQCVFLQRTSCSRTFTLHSVYGVSDLRFPLQFKRCLLDFVSPTQSLGENQDIFLLTHHKSCDWDREKDEAIACVLRGEFQDSDLIIAKSAL